MGKYLLTYRQQFIIPTTPLQTYPSSYFTTITNTGDSIPAESSEDGDSYYYDMSITGGGAPWNYKVTIDGAQLPEATDYFVCTASLTDIAGELVVQVTKFVDLVPYPSWRLRVDLALYPYSTFSVAPLSDEGDITAVTFSESLDYLKVRFGTPAFNREHFFVKLDGFAAPRIPFPLFGLGKSFPIRTGVEQFQ